MRMKSRKSALASLSCFCKALKIRALAAKKFYKEKNNGIASLRQRTIICSRHQDTVKDC